MYCFCLLELLLSCCLRYSYPNIDLLFFSLFVWLSFSQIFIRFIYFLQDLQRNFRKNLLRYIFQIAFTVHNIQCLSVCLLHFQVIRVLTPWKPYWIILLNPDRNCCFNLVFITCLIQSLEGNAVQHQLQQMLFLRPCYVRLLHKYPAKGKR